MPLDQIANVADIVGTVLIIVSLIYVVIQIKQSTDTLNVNTAHNIAAEISALYLVVAESGDLSDIFFRGVQGVDELEPVEALRFYGCFHKFYRAFEDAYYQFTRGALETEFFEGISQQFISFNSMPGVQRYWQDRKSWYNKSFQEYVDREVMSVDITGYKLPGT